MNTEFIPSDEAIKLVEGYGFAYDSPEHNEMIRLLQEDKDDEQECYYSGDDNSDIENEESLEYMQFIMQRK